MKYFYKLNLGRWALGEAVLPPAKLRLLDPPPYSHFATPVAISCCCRRGPAGPHDGGERNPAGATMEFMENV